MVSRMEGAPELLRHDYRASLHAAFSPEEVELQLQQAGMAAQLKVAPLQERYLEVWGRLNKHQAEQPPLNAGLIQSLSQAFLSVLSAWVEVGGIAPSLCLKAPPL